VNNLSSGGVASSAAIVVNTAASNGNQEEEKKVNDGGKETGRSGSIVQNLLPQTNPVQSSSSSSQLQVSAELQHQQPSASSDVPLTITVSVPVQAQAQPDLQIVPEAAVASRRHKRTSSGTIKIRSQYSYYSVFLYLLIFFSSMLIVLTAVLDSVVHLFFTVFITVFILYFFVNFAFMYALFRITGKLTSLPVRTELNSKIRFIHLFFLVLSVTSFLFSVWQTAQFEVCVNAFSSDLELKTCPIVTGSSSLSSFIIFPDCIASLVAIALLFLGEFFQCFVIMIMIMMMMMMMMMMM
jgi:hypothetical protein